MRKFVAAVPFALAVLIAGCSSSTPTPPTRHAGTGTVHSGHIGATIDLTTKSNKPFTVTVSKVIDPAQGLAGVNPKPGRRFVAAVLTISNTGSLSISPNLTTDAIVIASNGQLYPAGPKKLSSCAGFTKIRFKLQPGSSASGCATFQVPTGLTVTQVQFLPTGGTAGDYGQWLNP